MTDHVLPVATVTSEARQHLRELIRGMGLRHVILTMGFFEQVASLLEYADRQLLEGESLDLDELAQLITAHVRPNLTVRYGCAIQPEGGIEAARAEYIEALDALRLEKPGAYDRAVAAAQRLIVARHPAA